MLIDNTDELLSLCDKWSKAPYLAVDTEFMRDRTYYPQLCLIQVCHGDVSAVIDAQAPKLDLDPLFDLFEDPNIIKVFHSASQDMEVFFAESQFLPAPLFDTQIAAMVCGFGDQVGYARLVGDLVGATIDKSFQLTDWSRRPLTKKQLAYALDDVVHLCTVYEKLLAELKKTGRETWVEEDMANLVDKSQYEIDWSQMWRRAKFPNPKPRSAAVMHEIASWREKQAQDRNVPKNWVIKDTSLVEIANTRPTTAQALKRVRGLDASFVNGKKGAELLEAIKRGVDKPRSEWPDIGRGKRPAKGNDNLIALLQALLKLACERHKVAPRLIANRAELEKIAAEENPDVRALKGWRNDIFGKDAIALKEGRLALTGSRKGIELVEIEEL
ncbi:MAG: ribonuclease D [Planctomycetota bacterium]|nr:ribonuclease D [Planctomycetota bacterium]